MYIGFWQEARKKRPLQRPKCEYKNDMDLREIGCDGMDWIDLAQDGDQ
jgi:hypothetical protein